MRERFVKRLGELDALEGQLWAELHAVQGRRAELQVWLGVMEGEAEGEETMTVGELAEAIERGQEPIPLREAQ